MRLSIKMKLYLQIYTHKLTQNELRTPAKPEKALNIWKREQTLKNNILRSLGYPTLLDLVTPSMTKVLIYYLI